MVNGEKQFEHIDQGDVVILPAFGATIQVRTFSHRLSHSRTGPYEDDPTS